MKIPPVILNNAVDVEIYSKLLTVKHLKWEPI